MGGRTPGIARHRLELIARIDGSCAVERATGPLRGKRGTFALRDGATAYRGAPAFNPFIVHDSGADEPAGRSGRMNIVITLGGKRSHEFDCTLAKRG